MAFPKPLAAPPPRISLVVPAFDEERLLPQLLASVEIARRSFARGREAVEVLVADNASTDRTAQIAAAHGCRVARVEKRAIAAARNGGAAAARGEIVAFTDADGRIHPRTFDEIDRAMSDPRLVGGATGLTMERWSLGIGLTFALALPWLWLWRFDSGVVFCRRHDFDAVGGYDEELRFGEDVAFLLALSRHGKASRRRLTRLRGVKTVASARKFDLHGDWHFFTRMPALGWRFLRGHRDLTQFAERYWYRRER